MITTQINGKNSSFRRVGWIGFESLDRISINDYKNTFIDLGSDFANLIPSIEYKDDSVSHKFDFYSADENHIYNYNGSLMFRSIFSTIIVPGGFPSEGVFTMFPLFGLSYENIAHARVARVSVEDVIDYKIGKYQYTDVIDGIIHLGSNLKIGTVKIESYSDYDISKLKYRGIKFYECLTENVNGRIPSDNAGSTLAYWSSYTVAKKGNLVASLIPIALSDGTAGLYNEATGKFYGTNGPGRVLFGN